MTESSTPIIHTPDQRLRVFVSSTLQELANERSAAREAIEHLRLTPVMFELGARPHPPRDLYRAYLDQSHIFIGIYWQKYGWVAPGEAVSGLEDEYRLSSSKPKLIYIKKPSPDQEPRLKELIERIRRDELVSYKYFSASNELCELIQNDLALLLTERFEQLQAPASGTKIDRQTTNLPTPMNRLIGREQQLAIAKNLLLRDGVNLVTLTGPGGTGKSLLGLYAALDLRDHFKDGAFIVSLALINDPNLFVSLIAQTLGVHDSGTQPLYDTLTEYLSNKQLLLLLDNFEQIIAAAPTVSRLLESCPQIKALVTSRTLLRLRGEQELPIPTLALPEHPHRLPVDQLAQYPAIELFVQRAQNVKPDFKITPNNAQTIAEVCHRLDGLPLAIELAASRIKILTPQMLLDRLEHRFDILRGGTRDLPERQRTLHGTIDWSYNLLDENSKRLFRRMAVFVGGCALDAAEDVCNAAVDLAPDILDLMEMLIQNSLLIATEVDGDRRFSMLGIIRDYAFEQLTNTNEVKTTQWHHALYYLDLAEEAEPQFNSRNRPQWLQRLYLERYNLRAAITWSQSFPDSEIELRFAGALAWYWFFSGSLSEARVNVEHALTRVDPADRTALHAMVLFSAGGFASAQGEYDVAHDRLLTSTQIFRNLNEKRHCAYALLYLALVKMSRTDVQSALATFQESIELFKAVGDPWGEAYALTNLGESLLGAGAVAKAREVCESGLKLWRHVGDTWGIGNQLGALGSIEWLEGDEEASRRYCQESVDLLRQHYDKWGLARALHRLAFTLLFLNDVPNAKTYSLEALDLWRAIGNQRGVMHSLICLAGVMAKSSQPDRAAQLVGAIDAFAGQSQFLMFGADHIRYKRTVSMVRASMDESIWSKSFNAGRILTIDEAIAFVLEDNTH